MKRFITKCGNFINCSEVSDFLWACWLTGVSVWSVVNWEINLYLFLAPFILMALFVAFWILVILLDHVFLVNIHKLVKKIYQQLCELKQIWTELE